MMKKMSIFRRLCSLLLVAAFFLSLAPALPVSAANHPQTYSKMSSSYKSSVYYQNLMAIELTGDPITDLLQVAYSQLGYKESAKKSQLGGDGDGDGNCTEYGLFTGTNGYAWCASFVSWCFREAGIPKSVMPTSAGVGGLRKSVYSCGATWHSVDSGYKPKTGDLVIYEGMDSKYTYYIYASRDKNGVPTVSSHVGIVVEDFDEKTQTYAIIDGNGNGGKVKYLDNQKLMMLGPTKNGGTLNRIQGFITPDYYGKNSSSGGSGSSGASSPKVSLTAPTSASYANKQKVTNTNAVVVTKITKSSGSNITRSGVVLSAADGTVIKDYWEKVTNVGKKTTSFHSWFDIQKELGVTLTPGTTYKYQFYAVVDGQTFWGDVRSLTTTGKAPGSSSSGSSGSGSSSGNSSNSSSGSNPPAQASPKATLSVPTDPAYVKKQKVTDTNAVVVTQIAKKEGTSITRSGVVLSAADGSLIKDYWEKVTNVGKGSKPFHSWFDIQKELGVTLTPGTTYQYQFYVVVDGQTYWGDVRSLTTTGQAPSSSKSSSSKEAAAEGVSFDGNGQAEISTASRQFVCYMQKPYGSRLGRITISVYSLDGSQILSISASGGAGQDSLTDIDLTCTVSEQSIAKLTPGEQYQYEIQAVVDGQRYTSSRFDLLCR